MTRAICLALASLSLSATLHAQRPVQRVTPPAAAARPEVLRGAAVSGFGVPVAAVAGTRITRAASWLGTTCVGPGGGCLVAQGAGPLGLDVQLGDGSARGARAGLLLGHGQAHTLGVWLDGREVMGFSCDGRTIRLRAPGGGAFRWSVLQGQKVVGSGRSAGEAVDVQSPPHPAGRGMPMELSVQHRDPARLAGADDAWCKKYGCLTLALAHGDHHIRVMPVLERDAPLELRTMGLRVTGAPSFALTRLDVR